MEEILHQYPIISRVLTRLSWCRISEPSTVIIKISPICREKFLVKDVLQNLVISDFVPYLGQSEFSKDIPYQMGIFCCDSKSSQVESKIAGSYYYK